MHIPDGYLSPSTCAVMAAACLPFWGVALRRVQAEMNARTAPLLSVCAAFVFVIMMFNIPLPGGTTGHAVGVGVTAILLGPWASILAISLALLIQAVFFGDGGVLAFGANVFNIAIVGSLAAHAVYRLAAGTAEPGSRRRVIAAGLAGYAALHAAAFFTAMCFGIQPVLFHDATGVPLYAPYPLSVAVPAMMIGHLAFAGIAEGILTAGVVAWLQHSDPALFRPQEPPKRSSRLLWAGVMALILAAPLGLLATGDAWGEWTPHDFQNPEGREAIAAANFGKELPLSEAPAGMRRWAGLWAAPWPDYETRLGPALGYIACGAGGVALTLLGALALQRALRRKPQDG